MRTRVKVVFAGQLKASKKDGQPIEDWSDIGPERNDSADAVADAKSGADAFYGNDNTGGSEPMAVIFRALRDDAAKRMREGGVTIETRVVKRTKTVQIVEEVFEQKAA